MEAPTVSDLVLVGGGHAHVHLLKMLGMLEHRKWRNEIGIRVTLIARDLHTPYSGMLPGFVAGSYTYDEIHLDLNRLCQFSNIRLIHASATRVVHTSDERYVVATSPSNVEYPPIRYDALSINIGSAPSSFSKQAQSSSHKDSVIPVKPIAHFCKSYRQLKEQLEEIKPSTYRIAVVGGGAGGIELALAIQHNLESIVEDLQIILVTSSCSILEQHNSKVRRIFERILRERHVQMYLSCTVESVESVADQGIPASDSKESSSCCSQLKKRLVISSSSAQQPQDDIVVDECFWCTNAEGASWLATATPFATSTAGNFIQVHNTYESVSHKGVFAAGDCCEMVTSPRPKAGVFAVRAGPPLLENLVSYLSQRPLGAHRPQRYFLGLISTGNPYAVASWGQFLALEGQWVWKWKDYIDQKWMDKYRILPDSEEMMKALKSEGRSSYSSSSIPANVSAKGGMVLEAFSADPMRCGGCGAKVGATTVSRVLATVQRRRIQRGAPIDGSTPLLPTDPDDAAVVPIPAGASAMIQTIDYFRSIVSDPFVFGQIAAVHSLSDIHAMGAKAETAMVLAVVPFAADEDITESTLVHLLSGVSDVLQEEGVQLTGGHTCEGVELACGLSVHSTVKDPSKLLRKKGGRVGDKIVLTKPLGTGALFAADMRARCRGAHKAEAVASMMTSNVAASRVASTFEKAVHACTDVTGFGLLGHLLEMLMANEGVDGLPSIAADLSIRDIQFLKGGLEASANGIYSSLQPQNNRNRRAVINHPEAAEAFPIEYPLLFDPQTAGGLLFFVDAETSGDMVDKMKLEGVDAAIIGELVEYMGTDTKGADVSDGVCTIASAGLATGKRVRIDL